MSGISRDPRGTSSPGRGHLRRSAVSVFAAVEGSPAAARKLRRQQRSAAVYNDRRAPRFSVRQSAGGSFRNADRANHTNRKRGIRARN
jgi:hypothetical protein